MNDTERTKESIDYAGVEAGDFAAFCQLVSVLRGEHGCPWDRAQTFESLKPCITDEVHEVLDGIDRYYETGDAENLCEELGDVLLNVVLMADMAREQELFTMEDLIRGIGRKMLRRHPHVFGEDARRGWEESDLEGLSELPKSWDEIKKLEKNSLK
jgi:tetrapyrrole methylase family protein/MazG family protein